MLILSCINLYHKQFNQNILPKWVIISISFFLISSIFLIFFSSNMNEAFTDVRRTIKFIFPVFFISLFY